MNKEKINSTYGKNKRITQEEWYADDKGITTKWGFYSEEGEAYLIKCPICKKENYAMNISSGVCVWCGHKEKNLKEK